MMDLLFWKLVKTIKKPTGISYENKNALYPDSNIDYINDQL